MHSGSAHADGSGGALARELGQRLVMTMIGREAIGCWLDNQEWVHVKGENKGGVAFVELMMAVWRGIYDGCLEGELMMTVWQLGSQREVKR